jgi:hypothetical protein
MTTKSPDSSRPLAEVIAELDAKIDRVAGLSTQAVTQLDRLIRIIAANAQLDARASQLDARTKRELYDLVAETRGVLSQVRDTRAELVRARASAAEAEELEPFRKRDDSITASVKLQISGEQSRKTVGHWLKLLAKAIAAGGVGALIKHLVAHH